MCEKVMCRKCNKPTWAGCGQHIEEALFDVAADRRLTFAELNSETNRVASLLSARGVKTGDRVGLLMMNSTEFVTTFFATAKLGAVIVPLNWRLVANAMALHAAKALAHVDEAAAVRGDVGGVAGSGGRSFPIHRGAFLAALGRENVQRGLRSVFVAFFVAEREQVGGLSGCRGGHWRGHGCGHACGCAVCRPPRSHGEGLGSGHVGHRSLGCQQSGKCARRDCQQKLFSVLHAPHRPLAWHGCARLR